MALELESCVESVIDTENEGKRVEARKPTQKKKDRKERKQKRRVCVCVCVRERGVWSAVLSRV